jgi:uncharacterized protein YaiE (UPF0345 family)
MQYLGDIQRGRSLYFAWPTFDSSGASVTRTVNGTVSVYKNDNTTQSTAGVTDTEDFDTLTGIHWVKIDTSADATFYAAGNDFTVVLSGATIDGQTVNAVLGHFSVENRFRGEGRRAVAQAAGATSLTLDASASATTDFYKGWTFEIVDGTAAGLSGLCTAYNGGTKVATIDPTWATTPSGTPAFLGFPGPMPATVAQIQSGLATEAAVTTITDKLPSKAFLAGTANADGDIEIGDVTGTLPANVIAATSIASNAITNAKFAAGAINATVIATGAIDADALAADAVDEILDEVIEGSVTLRQLIRGFAAVLPLSKCSGMATATGTFRDINDTKDRVVVSQDADGNRTAITLDLT